MKKQHSIGIVVGVVTGLVVGFVMQACGIWLGWCVGAMCVVGLEIGYWVGVPDKTLEVHKRVFTTLWFVPRVDGARAKRAAARFAAIIISLAVALAIFLLTAWVVGVFRFGTMIENSKVSFAGCIVMLVEMICMVYAYGFWFGMPEGQALRLQIKKLLTEKISNPSWRLVAAGVIIPFLSILLALSIVMYFVWLALTIPVLPFVLISSVCRLAAKRECAVITAGVIGGILAGFIIGALGYFTFTGEAFACAVGAVIGVVVGRVAVFFGREKVAEKFIAWFHRYRVHGEVFDRC